MELLSELNTLAHKIKQQISLIQTEEATKSAFVMPFINNILGYDVFNPLEVIPEFVCDVGTKKGEKIDYAIMKDAEIQMLVECKKIGEPLNINHASQLFRYFHVTTARVGILTNGQVYKFFTDLNAPNKMDDIPFLELDIMDIDENIVSELVKLTKVSFDINSVINTAEELKYLTQIKKLLSVQFINPEPEFIRFFASRVYDGILTQKARELFSLLTCKATSQWLNDQVNERLKSAMTSIGQSSNANPATVENIDIINNEEKSKNDNEIITTELELEGFYIVKSIARTVVDSDRISYRDGKTYFSIIVDNNNRKLICRLYLNRGTKYLTFLNNEKIEVKNLISSLDDIYNFATEIKDATSKYII